MVYCLAFNNPFGDRVATGSFDKTAKVSKKFNKTNKFKNYENIFKKIILLLFKKIF